MRGFIPPKALQSFHDPIRFKPNLEKIGFLYLQNVSWSPWTLFAEHSVHRTHHSVMWQGAALTHYIETVLLNKKYLSLEKESGSNNWLPKQKIQNFDLYCFSCSTRQSGQSGKLIKTHYQCVGQWRSISTLWKLFLCSYHFLSANTWKLIGS